MTTLILSTYIFLLSALALYGLHRYWILFLYWRHKKSTADYPALEHSPGQLPFVTVQLPLFNEKYVVERLIDAVCNLDYPREKLEVQVLDDSTDETSDLALKSIATWQTRGVNVLHLKRKNRQGYKAGALAWGLTQAKGDFIAIFDADFIPPRDFLFKTLTPFQDPAVGMVQTRWGHLNEHSSLLTKLQAIFLDGHFLLEHTARFKSGAFFNFNGTAGIWRRTAITSSGGWSAATLTEDLDLSYRAQLKGWRFIYLPHVVCPAELPIDIHAFRTQQNRWAKGALQVARRLLGSVWRGRFSLLTKIEATFHLTANIGYLLTMGMTLLLLPLIILREPGSWSFLRTIEFITFSFSITSLIFFYGYSQKELHKDWVRRIKNIPALLGLGVAMGLANSKAVWEGLIGHPTEFIRTPKYGVTLKRKRPLGKTYDTSQQSFALIQLFFAFYSTVAFIWAITKNNWSTLPFLSLFVAGFSYAGFSAIKQRKAALSVLFIFLFGCRGSAENIFNQTFWKHWGDGRAELAHYELITPRYGELRKGVAVAIFVTEPFSNELRVKADPGKHSRSDEFQVIKLNLIRDFQTGIYDYNLMTSAFMSLAPFDSFDSGFPAKISFSAQEWCGHVYDQLIFRNHGIEYESHSYFDGEADRKLTIAAPKNLTSEDALFLWARGLAEPFLKSGEKKEAPMISSLMTSRLLHQPLTQGKTHFSFESRASSIRVPAGTFSVQTRRVVLSDGKTRTFYVEAAFPHRLIKWETSEGEMGQLIKSERLAYWKMNTNKSLPFTSLSTTHQ